MPTYMLTESDRLLATQALRERGRHLRESIDPIITPRLPERSASNTRAKPIRLRCWPRWSSKAFAWTSGRRIMSSVAMPDWDRNVS